MVGDILTLDSGRVRGVSSSGGVTRFLGIPYAAAPVGDLRWRPPQSVESWSGVREATDFGAGAPQGPIPEASIYYGHDTVFDEDCLFLNVFTSASPASGRPVMVWLHYGAYQLGSGSNPLFNGDALARDGITVVTLNHRLGRLGFLAHPWLTNESGGQGSGNYGLMDIVAALEWVKRNIEAFGGDPGCVTLFGVSAGGNSVHTLRACPSARGLFHRGIAQSGPGFGPALDGPGHPGAPQSLSAGEQAGEELTRILRVSSLAELRALPVAALNDVQLPRAGGDWRFNTFPGARISTHVFDSGYPVVDGHFFPETPQNAHKHGRQLDIPMIIGHAAAETASMPFLSSLADYEAFAEAEFGDFADEFLRLYPASTDDEVEPVTRELDADRTFVWSSWTAARAQRRSGSQAGFYYRFDRQPPVPRDRGLIEASYAGAFHTVEVPYIFGTLQARDWPWTEGDRHLARLVSGAWRRFAATGDPNGADGPDWPAFDDRAPTSLLWDLEPELGTPVDTARIDLLDRFNSA